MPNSISVSYSEKHMGALKIACAGNAMVLMCRASELLNHSQGGKAAEPGPGEEGPILYYFPPAGYIGSFYWYGTWLCLFKTVILIY